LAVTVHVVVAPHFVVVADHRVWVDVEVVVAHLVLVEVVVAHLVFVEVQVETAVEVVHLVVVAAAEQVPCAVTVVVLLSVAVEVVPLQVPDAVIVVVGPCAVTVVVLLSVAVTVCPELTVVIVAVTVRVLAVAAEPCAVVVTVTAEPGAVVVNVTAEPGTVEVAVTVCVLAIGATPMAVVVTVSVVAAGHVLLCEVDAVEEVDVAMIGAAQLPSASMILVSSVTAAVKAKRPPFVKDTPVVAVMDACAMTKPVKIVAVPSVAELPTCQKTLQP
jgi:hypothetical protein